VVRERERRSFKEVRFDVVSSFPGYADSPASNDVCEEYLWWCLCLRSRVLSLSFGNDRRSSVLETWVDEVEMDSEDRRRGLAIRNDMMSCDVNGMSLRCSSC
jgi:hypothetical protein